MKLFMLRDNGNGKFYKRRNQWVSDPQQATVWTSAQGVASAKGSCYPRPSEPETIEFDSDVNFTNDIREFNFEIRENAEFGGHEVYLDGDMKFCSSSGTTNPFNTFDTCVGFCHGYAAARGGVPLFPATPALS